MEENNVITQEELADILTAIYKALKENREANEE
jgi:hypothetical protein